MAYRACENASRTELALGCVGGGMGATVGKFCGAPYAMKSGIGAYAVQAGAIRVGAIVVVNALGDIFDVDTSRQIAGLRTEDGRGLRSTEEQLYAGIEVARNPFSANKTATNTTIGAIVTNAAFSKAELTRVASTAHNGFARAIRPVHTTADGDSIYACSVGREKADLNAVATLASYVMAKAIGVGVRAARDGFGLPCAQTLGTV